MAIVLPAAAVAAIAAETGLSAAAVEGGLATAGAGSTLIKLGGKYAPSYTTINHSVGDKGKSAAHFMKSRNKTKGFGKLVKHAAKGGFKYVTSGQAVKNVKDFGELANVLSEVLAGLDIIEKPLSLPVNKPDTTVSKTGKPTSTAGSTTGTIRPGQKYTYETVRTRLQDGTYKNVRRRKYFTPTETETAPGTRRDVEPTTIVPQSRRDVEPTTIVPGAAKTEEDVMLEFLRARRAAAAVPTEEEAVKAFMGQFPSFHHETIEKQDGGVRHSRFLFEN